MIKPMAETDGHMHSKVCGHHFDDVHTPYYALFGHVLYFVVAVIGGYLNRGSSKR